jgi:hypothetical protein
MNSFNPKKLIRRILAILLVLDAGFIAYFAATYVPSLFYPSIVTLPIVVILATPLLLISGAVGLFFGRPWSRRWLLAAFFANLLAGLSFVPCLPLLTNRLLSIPFAGFLVTHTVNFTLIAVAWFLAVDAANRPAALPGGSPAEGRSTSLWAALARIAQWASPMVLALVVVVWPISAFGPIHCAGIVANRSLLAFHADILDIADNRVWVRSYKSYYRDGEAFHIEAICGGMPFSTDTKRFTPLEHDWRLLGVRLGYDFQLLPYRCDWATDIVLPMWLLTLLSLPAPLFWLFQRLKSKKRRQPSS